MIDSTSTSGPIHVRRHPVRECDAGAESLEDLETGIELVLDKVVVELDRLVQLDRFS